MADTCVWNWWKIVESCANFFFVDGRACVRVVMKVSESFPVNVGLIQGCVMSPWLFNINMNDVVGEVNARVLGKWLKLLCANSGRYEINQFSFAYDSALVADSMEKLLLFLSESVRANPLP